LYSRVSGSTRVWYWGLVLYWATITLSITHGYEILSSCKVGTTGVGEPRDMSGHSFGVPDQVSQSVTNE
jgi:hypothetical protein